MTYPALPGRAIPYHMDGTVVKVGKQSDGIVHHFTAAELAELNDYDYVDVYDENTPQTSDFWVIFFFPERRRIRGLFALFGKGSNRDPVGPTDIEGSNDTTNGFDGTWTALSAPNGFNADKADFDQWRKDIAAIDDGGVAYKAIRIRTTKGAGPGWGNSVKIVHLYGEKESTETPDDIVFVDVSTGNELTLPIDFGAVPAGASDIRSFKIRNTSSTLEAQNITIAVNDPDDIIRVAWDSNGPWYTSLTITSLLPGAESNVIYVKAEPPAPPTPLKPHRAPIEVTVGAWA